MSRERVRGIIALIIAATSCAVVLLVVGARLFGGELSERGRTGLITLMGALVAALATYLATGRK